MKKSVKTPLLILLSNMQSTKDRSSTTMAV